MSRTPARFTQADVERALLSGDTFIYFIRSGDYIKIGQSRNWHVRLAGMQVGSPHTLVTMLVLVEKPAFERQMHSRFRRDHFRGEWFHSGLALLEFIKERQADCVSHINVGRTILPEAPVIEL